MTPATGTAIMKKRARQTATTMPKRGAIDKQPEKGQPIQLPEGGFEHPFQDSEWDWGPRQGKEHPRTVRGGFPRRRYKFSTSHRQVIELWMCTLSHYIREKPNWWEKLKDEAIVEKWKEEVLQQQEEALRQVDEALRQEEAPQQEKKPSHQEKEDDKEALRKVASAGVKSCDL